MSYRLTRLLLIVSFTGLLVACVTTQETRQSQWRYVRVDPVVQSKFDKALKYLQDEKFDEAIELLEKVVETEKRLPAPYVNLGMAYSRNENFEMAEEQFIKALKLDPLNPLANNELGLLYRKTGRFGDARKAYETGLSKHPDYLPARKNLGILCEIYLRNLECALTHYQQYQKYSPGDKEVNMWVADIKQRIGR